MKKLLLLPVALILGHFAAFGQLFVDTSYTVNQMITGFFDNSGIAISNVQYTGSPAALAFFEGSQSNIGINAGLLITSGEASTAIGPDDQESAGTNLTQPGTPWLNALIGSIPTYDAAIVEMDIVPSTDTIAFRYVFGSEEYQEFVNTSYNDLFAFFIEGPGFGVGDSVYVAPDTVVIYGNNCYTCVDTFLLANQPFCYPQDSLSCIVFPNDTVFTYCFYDQNNCQNDTIYYPGYSYYSPGGTNMAQVPNTNLPVAINNLNQFINTQYFVDNQGGASVQYDAFTTPLWAVTNVVPGETYHIRIAIADAGDGIFDSGVFLSIESLGGDSLLAVDPEFLATPNGNEVAFDNNTLWATAWEWDFGDGATSTERFPTHTYAADGVYEVKLKASNWCSQETYKQDVQIGTSSVHEPAAAAFAVSPNPTSGTFKLDLKNDNTAHIRLFGSGGRLLLDQNVQNGAQIDLDRFGKGVYVLQVQSDNQTWRTRVINR